MSGTASTSSLQRRVGVPSAALMVVGGIIGSGIFFTPAEVARALPDAASIMSVWVAGGLVALAGALAYAELGALLPDAGGPYVYIRHAFGPLAAFLYAWVILLLIGTGAIAAVATGFAGYLARFADLAPVGGERSVAAATVVALTITNIVGLRPGIVIQNALTVAKIAALGALIVLGFAMWGGVGSEPMAGAPVAPSLWPRGLAAAFVPVLFTIGGWQQMNMVAGEIRDPQRSIPRALLLGIAIVVAIYLGANAVYVHTLGRDGLAASEAVAAATMSRLVGPWGERFIAASAMLSILGFIQVALFANSRVVFALARDGAFLAPLGRVHPRFGTPHMALAAMGAWALVLLVASGGQLGVLLSGVVFADWIFFGLGAASLFVLRRTMPDAPRPYRAWGYPWLPGVFVVSAAVGVASAILAAPRTSLIGAVILTVGAGVYGAKRAAASGG